MVQHVRLASRVALPLKARQLPSDSTLRCFQQHFIDCHPGRSFGRQKSSISVRLCLCHMRFPWVCSLCRQKDPPTPFSSCPGSSHPISSPVPDSKRCKPSHNQLFSDRLLLAKLAFFMGQKWTRPTPAPVRESLWYTLSFSQLPRGIWFGRRSFLPSAHVQYDASTCCGPCRRN